MRATLLESNPDFSVILPCVFDAAGIPLQVVGTPGAIQRAMRTAGPYDFVIVDCSLNRPEDKARCGEVVQRTSLDLFIIYDPRARDAAPFMRSMERGRVARSSGCQPALACLSYWTSHGTCESRRWHRASRRGR
jgi:hypothetical protein